MAKPTIVIVPGAWHIPEHLIDITTRLEGAGYTVKTLRMPSTTGTSPIPNFDPDVKLISQTIEQAADDGQEVVLVMHSSGGAAGGEACKGLLKIDRDKDGRKGGVVRCVYMTSFALPEGTSPYKSTGGPSPWIEVRDGYSKCMNSENIFYNDLTPEQTKRNIGLLQLHSTGALWSDLTYAPFKHIPCTYLLCEKDNAIPVAFQEQLATQEGAKFDVIERCSAGHTPFQRFPDFTTEVIRRAAGERIESSPAQP